MNPCSGFYVTSFDEFKKNDNLDNLTPLYGDYDRYKRITTYPLGLKGKNLNIHNLNISTFNYFIVSDYEWKNKLRFVRIYFDTPTFDRITKDRAAKFVDMLSAIGGTMGLLTGFSIISGVEIIYFTGQIVLKMIKKKK